MTRRHPRAGALLAGALASALVVGCSGPTARPPDGAARTVASETAPAPAEPSATPAKPSATPAEPSSPQPEPRRSFLTIPAIGLRSMPVVRYPGSPDDARGTRIQNRGPTASPRGPGGGVGPGEVGNFIVTGHRTSHAAPFRDLPVLRRGDRVRVRSGAAVYVYRVVRTRWTSFRSERSLAAQSAAVPGRPEAEPVRPMITLSTCATPEDHAAGNYWADRFGNPEHRIDKVGVLVAERRAGQGPVEAEPAATRARRLEHAVAVLRSDEASRTERRRAAEFHQVAMRRLAAAAVTFRRKVVSRLSPGTARVVRSDVRAARLLHAMTDPQRELPDWRIVPPLPAPELRGYYRLAERRTGVPWVFLAGIHLVETRMGRIRGTSSAGARGPMQFLPSTWDLYGAGGDINDARDAILAAGRLLRAHGAPERMAEALWHYNPSDSYVGAVREYAGVMRRSPWAYQAYRHWRVLYRHTRGTYVLPVGYPEQRPVLLSSAAGR